MSSNLLSDISIFANRFLVPTSAEHALPSVFSKIAKIGNQPVRSIVNQATYTNKPLGDYVKATAVKVSRETSA